MNFTHITNLDDITQKLEILTILVLNLYNDFMPQG